MVDWRRYDFGENNHLRFNLPEKDEEMCRRIVSDLELAFGAIDIVASPRGELFFLEVNPNGQWAWIEALTKQQISVAIADLLVSQGTKKL